MKNLRKMQNIELESNYLDYLIAVNVSNIL